MSTKSEKEIFEWVENDGNKAKIQSALNDYPYLVNMKNSVSSNKYFLFILLLNFND